MSDFPPPVQDGSICLSLLNTWPSPYRQEMWSPGCSLLQACPVPLPLAVDFSFHFAMAICYTHPPLHHSIKLKVFEIMVVFFGTENISSNSFHPISLAFRGG